MTLITNIYIASSGVDCTSSRQHLHGCRSRNLANFIWNEMVIKIAYPVWIIRPEIKKLFFYIISKAYLRGKAPAYGQHT
jgi:hypothetical protein